jgi:hypothetical protein
MSERSSVIYVVPGTDQWISVNVEDGIVTPPTITFHRPLVGPVEFFYAEIYRLPIPKEAKAAKT